MKYSIIILLALLISSSVFSQRKSQISLGIGPTSYKFFMDSPYGYLVEGRYMYNFSDSIQIMFSTGYQHWKVTFGPGGSRFNAFPILAGIRLMLPINNFVPYIAGEAGVHFIKRDYKFEEYEMSELGLFRLISSEPACESVIKFSYRLNIGVIILLSNFFDLDLSLRYNNIAYDYIYIYPINISTGSIKLYSIFIGLNFNL